MNSRRVHPHRSRRGMTLLEVVLAVSLLVLVASLITSTLGQIESVETMDRKRLGACEMANRLMLQYLDDANALPDKTLAVPYGTYLFTWTLDEEPVKMTLNEEHRERSAPGAASAQMLDRFLQVTVTVWQAEDTGHGGVRRVGDPLAEVVRMYDPFVMRNPDAQVRFGDNPDNIANLLARILGGRRPETPEEGGRGRGRDRNSNRRDRR